MSRILATLALAGALLPAVSHAQAQAQAQDGIADRFRALTRAAEWRPAGTVTLAFPSQHPQGMARIDGRFLISSVEITERTQRYDPPREGMDRSAGRGTGHLFEAGADGTLLRSITLGEGDIYHPGGVDFDGTHLWVPVAEYRPNSRSIVYRVDPATLRAEEMFRVPDHIGGLVMDRASSTLHGVSWGSRRLWQWKIGPDGRPVGEGSHRPNPSFYVDYQDCHSAGAGRMLCGGLNVYRPGGPNGPTLALGGLDLVDLERGTPIHQLPVERWTESGLPMTQNPFAVALQGNGLRFWFAPEDDTTRIFAFDVTPR